jgi:hypothetical protein
VQLDLKFPNKQTNKQEERIKNKSERSVFIYKRFSIFLLAH